jgi:hypothetical protein
VDSTKKTARLAGVLYLLMALTAPLGLLIVPDKLFVAGDAAATADHIRAGSSLLRLGVASELVHQIINIFLVLVLYQLFKAVHPSRALQMMTLALLAVPIMFVNVLNEVAALTLTSGAGFLSAFDKPHLDALAYLFIRLHGHGIFLAQVFWGLWLFPFGSLVIRSRFIPRTFGVLLIVAGLANLANALGFLLLPTYGVLINQIAMPLSIAELPITFWFLIWGAKPQGIGPRAA